MGMMIQFPSPALWHQILAGPPVTKDQGTRNPIGGFSEMVHAQLAQQNAIAGLQQPPRPPLVQRAPEKDARDKGRDRDRPPRGQERREENRGGHEPAPDARPQAMWA